MDRAANRRSYPFHPVKTAGALLMGLGVFGGWLLGAGPTLVAPVLNPLSSGLLAGATTFSGTATPNSRVQLFIADKPVGIAAVDANGQWQLSADLPQGSETVLAKALQGDTPTLESNALNLSVGAPQTAPMAILDNVTINEPRIDVNAFLPNAPFLLTGTSTAGDNLEVYDGSSLIGKTTAGADGNWFFNVDPAGVGDRDYSVWKAGSSSGPFVTLNIAEKNGTTAACPCKLRFILVNPAAQDAQITLTGPGTIPASSAQTISFQGKTVREISYPALPAGSFDFTVAQSSFKPVRGNAAPPKNRAITVYLDPQK
jgi:hypothetical protein